MSDEQATIPRERVRAILRILDLQDAEEIHEVQIDARVVRFVTMRHLENGEESYFYGLIPIVDDPPEGGDGTSPGA